MQQAAGEFIVCRQPHPAGMELDYVTAFGSSSLGMSTVMKPRESALRLKRFTAEEKARKVADLEAMIREFDQMAADLNRQIATEEDRTGVKDRAHFAYSTFAKAAAQRRDNLTISVEDLRAKLTVAMQERDAANDILSKSETSDSREIGRGRRRGEGSDARVG